MVYQIYVCETPQLPLKHYEETTAFKIYMLDQAILRTMTELPPEAAIAKGDWLKEILEKLNITNFNLSATLPQTL